MSLCPFLLYMLLRHQKVRVVRVRPFLFFPEGERILPVLLSSACANRFKRDRKRLSFSKVTPLSDTYLPCLMYSLVCTHTYVRT